MKSGLTLPIYPVTMTDHRNHHPLLPLRAVPTVAVALAAVLFTIWLAAGNLHPHSLFIAGAGPGAAS